MRPYPHGVPANAGPGYRSLRHRTTCQRSAGCSRNTSEGLAPRLRSGHQILTMVPFAQVAQDKISAPRKFWRRRELNPRPKSRTARSLHVYPVLVFSPSRIRNRQEPGSTSLRILPGGLRRQPQGQPTKFTPRYALWAKRRRRAALIRQPVPTVYWQLCSLHQITG